MCKYARVFITINTVVSQGEVVSQGYGFISVINFYIYVVVINYL